MLSDLISVQVEAATLVRAVGITDISVYYSSVIWDRFNPNLEKGLRKWMAWNTFIRIKVFSGPL